VAKFYLNWTTKGQAKKWSSGKKAVLYDEVIDLPPDAQNVTLNAQAMTGLLGSLAWKTIIDQPVEMNRTYTVTGTVFKPGWK
jgi:hypothetical protein